MTNRWQNSAGLFILATFIGLSASYGDVWKSFTSKRAVRAVTMDRNGLIWTSTNGGLFSFRQSDSTFSQFTTSEGLRAIDLSAVAADSTGSLWIGSSEGILHRYYPLRNSWQYINDIYLQDDPQKRINRLQVYGDTLAISSEIGLLFFSISKMEFEGTIRKFGSGSRQITGTVTGFALFGDRIWASTRSGIASTPVSNPNSTAPESWQIASLDQGLPSATVNSLVVLGDTLFAATSAGLCRYDGLNWSTVSGTEGREILDCSPVRGGTFSFITASDLWTYTPGVQQIPEQNFSGHTLTSLWENSIVGTDGEGILLPHSGTAASVIPPGPVSNSFISLAVDNRGVLWAGTGSANGSGIMSFDGQQWKSFTTTTEPRLLGNEYYKVNIGRDNSKWISSWGTGVALFDDRGSFVKLLNTSNGLPMTANSGDNPAFCVVGAVVTDANGIAWILNRAAPSNIAVMLFKPDSSLDSSVTFFRNLLNPLTIFTDAVIDYNGTKWFANSGRFEPVAAQELYYYNERYALPGTTSGWGSLNVSDGLTSKNIWSLAVDRDGELWIGSDAGVTIIYDPSNPAARMVSYHPLRDQIIQCILVDPLNNKWIGTRQGAFVLSADGTSILNRYTVGNTDGKLLSDDIASLSMDGNTGTIYFGTEKGLSSLKTLAVSPRAEYDEITVTPNPFYIPSALPLTVPDTIGGLVEYSSIKILSVDGTLVRELQSHTDEYPGGRVAVWDGRNQRGELVATGVYVIVASSEDGSKISTGKVAVVRR